MAHHAHIHHVSPISLPAIHRVSTEYPWKWLAAGWRDFSKAPLTSMGYGFAVTLVMSVVFQILQTGRFYAFALALMAGFVFIGPLLAVGLYEISRNLAKHETVSFAKSRYGWGRNRGAILGAGVVMLLMLMTWFMLSAQATAMIYGISGGVGTVIGGAADWQAFALSLTWTIVLSFGLTGLIAVSVTYVMMVVSVPMLTDREDMDLITAIVTSGRAVRKNPAAMSLWAGLIAIFTAVAVAPLFLGLIVVFPLLAYASWHAYQDLIEH